MGRWGDGEMGRWGDEGIGGWGCGKTRGGGARSIRALLWCEVGDSW